MLDGSAFTTLIRRLRCKRVADSRLTHRRLFDRQSSTALVSLLLLAIGIQFASGAFSTEMTTYPDEPAHFLSGLMVRDYVVDGLGHSPMQFAREYYSHYPKIGIGNWPPAYYAMQGLWMLATPTSRISTLVLLALMLSIVAWLTYRASRPTLGPSMAALAATSFLLFQPVPEYLSMVMAEVPLTFFFVLAAFFWMRFMETERTAYLAGFATFAVIAIMVKGNGLALVLLPPFSIIISRRWRVLRVAAVWKTAAAVAVLTVPWVIYYLPTMRAGWALPNESIGQFSSLAFYPMALWQVLGPALALLALLGIWARLGHRASMQGRLMWSTALGAVFAGIVFHTVAPGGHLDIRHLLLIYPFLAMFVAAGTFVISEQLSRVFRRPNVAAIIALTITGAIVLRHSLPFESPEINGFRSVAASLLPDQRQQEMVALIVSDGAGEGTFVVEVARRDHDRPTHTVWRGTKLLSSVTWAGRDYTLRETTTDGVYDLLRRGGVNVVVLDGSAHITPHHALLAQLVREKPEAFTLRGAFDVHRNGTAYPRAIEVYDVTPGAEVPPARALIQVPGYEGVAPRVTRTAP